MKVVEMYRLKRESKLELPLFTVRCPAGTGYPSPSDDYIEECIDLNKKLIKHPELGRVKQRWFKHNINFYLSTPTDK